MFNWKEEYRTGIRLIDHQHAKLLKIGSSLLQISNNDKVHTNRHDDIVKIIDELKDYAIYHFNYEEALFDSCDYSDRDRHEQSHKRFVLKLEEIDLTDTRNMQSSVLMDLLSLLSSWLEHHILIEDMAYIQELSAITQCDFVKTV